MEGNRGKSQLFDVASVQGPQADAIAISSPGAVAEVSFTNRNCGAMPTAIGVNAMIRQTGGADKSSGNGDLKIASGGENDSAVADLAATGDSAKASDASSLDRPVAVAAVAPGRLAADASSSMGQAAKPASGNTAGKQAAGATSAPFSAASDLVALGLSFAVKVKSQEKAGMVSTAGNYWRTDIVGLAVLAFVGQHFGQRWRQPTLDQPRPITMRRKKPVE